MARFRSGTRYSNGVFTTNSENVPFMILRKTLIINEVEDDTFLTLDSRLEKRLDLISYKVYGRPDLGWAIMDVNNMQDPLTELVVGKVLRIPALSRLLSSISKLNLDLL